jgi:chromosome segregation ATPase
MEAEDRAELVEDILDIARDEEIADGDNHAVARILVKVMDACSGEEQAADLHDAIEQRDHANDEAKIFLGNIDELRKEIYRLREELSKDKDRSKHLSEARDQAVAELQRVQAELEDYLQNGGRDRVDKLVKTRMAEERKEFSESEIRNRNEVNQLIREREVARQEAFETKQAFERSCGMRDKMSCDMASLRKELDEAKWDRAQLNKELELYRPNPGQDSTCMQQPKEAKP